MRHLTSSLLLCCLLLAGCAGSGPLSSSADDATQSGSVALPSGRQAAVLEGGPWRIVAGEHVFIDGEMLLFDAPPGERGWAIADLGEYQPDELITAVSLVPQDAVLPQVATPYAWLGLADYELGSWLIRLDIVSNMGVDFSRYYDIGQTTGPNGHAYLLLVAHEESTPISPYLAVIIDGEWREL